ncbi:MAG: Ig-like domain-containing protein [Spirochaetes bacterium]|nr:Ig-like domain-containing protein [Spirochaetota bacterium]
MLKNNLKHFIFLLLVLASCSRLGVDLDPPEIEDHYPKHNQYNIPNSTTVWIKFNEDMDKASVEKALQIESEGAHSGMIVWEGHQRFTYLFEKLLDTGKRYTVTLDKSAKDRTGNSLKNDLLFSFYINHETAIKPSIIQTIPANMSEGIGKDTDITIIFSKAMEIQSVQNNFTISPSPTGTFSWNSAHTVLQYQIIGNLQSATRYRVTLGKESSSEDGYLLGQEYQFNFLTGDSYTVPEISGIYSYGIPVPVYWTNNQQSINKDVQIAILFNKTMNHPDTESAFSLSPSVNGYFTWSTAGGETMIFHPTEDLQPETQYRLNISETAKDPDDHNLASAFQMNFLVNGAGAKLLKIMNVSDNSGQPLSFSSIDTVQLNGMQTNTFTINFNLSLPEKLDISSFQENVSISRISGWGDTGKLGAIEDFNYNADQTEAYIKIGSVSSNNYYKLEFNGGSSGIKDMNHNPMEEDIELIFLTK